MIGGCVAVDLSFEPELPDYSADRRALHTLDACPDGVRVVINIGSRKYVTPDAAAWIHRHDHRLIIEIQGSDPDVVARFVRAGRAGEWQEGA